MSNATALQTAMHVRERGDTTIMLVLAWLPPWTDLGGVSGGAGWFLVYGTFGFTCLDAERCELMLKDPLGNFTAVPAEHHSSGSGSGGAA